MVLPNLWGQGLSVTCGAAVLLCFMTYFSEFLPRVWLNFFWLVLLVWLLLDANVLLTENEALKRERKVKQDYIIEHIDKRLIKTEMTLFALIDAHRFKEEKLTSLLLEKTKNMNWRKTRSFSHTML